MKTLKVLIYFIATSLTLTSCLSTRKLIESDSLLGNNICALTGVYENVAVDVSDNPKLQHSLYVLLFKNFNQYNPYYNKDSDYEGKISIKAISDQKIQVDYIIGDKIKQSKQFTGIIKNNFFVIKRKWRLVGIPILFGGYDETKIAIGLNKDGFLYIRKGHYNFGGVIGLMGNSNEHHERSYYKQIEAITEDVINVKEKNN